MSAALGPLVYAAVSSATGSASAGLLTALAFLLAGGYVLAGVDASPAVGERAPAMKEARP
jgi:MFS-type transporter involved in bile tolerance (Atg22 family)